ncbi:acyl-ACP thioesterase [Oceanobacillus piezotolerans]|uniref:Acyl-ACP thioesterase n=2 Tax=Oceanobacillus piezotolerans TaxID=2448030 RepID=A0A498DCA8_9BACI|nr:acyl-ACP thioesterase [Oceanobacillus piezotolerans]
MEPVTLFAKKYHVDLSDVDFKKKLKLSTLFSYFQDAASDAASNLGAGIDVLEDSGIAWILMRIRVDILRLPKWDEEIVIETWPLEPKRLEFERDYLVKDNDGNTIIRAVSAWVIMDRVERKLMRSDSIALKYPTIIEERAIHCKLGKLKKNGQLEKSYERVIGYSDVDFNGHLNNSKYIDFMMDCFPIEDHMKSSPKRLEVNFVNEVLPGETIILHKDTSMIEEKRLYIEGINENTEKPVFKAVVEIE